MKRLSTTILGLALLATGSAMAATPSGQTSTPPAAPAAAEPGKAPVPGHRPSRHMAPPSADGGHRPAGPHARMGHHRMRPPMPPHAMLRLGHRLPRVDAPVVTEPGKHGLRKPARGEQWHRVGDRYALVTTDTGLVSEIVINGR